MLSVGRALPGGGMDETANALIEQALRELSLEDESHPSPAAEWDSQLAELATAVKTHIPAVVEERCRGAKQRATCGLMASLGHAWASADAILHIWDYRSEKPHVVVVPADSAIVSVGVCPPRPGIFEGNVDLVLVLCTRLTVSLIGLHCVRIGEPQAAARRSPNPQTPGWGAAPAARAAPHGWGAAVESVAGYAGTPAGSAPQRVMPASTIPTWGGRGTTWSSGGLDVEFQEQQRPTSLQLVPLEGYACRTEGALFHSVRHTLDGHILLICGAPQVYEIAYSRTPGWFHAKCRLIRHMPSVRSWVRDFLSISASASGRLRLLECAQHDYAVTVDDLNTVRLFGIRDQVVHRAESVALVEELAALTAGDLASQVFAMRKAQTASRHITHAFPVLGLDGHLRVHVVTAARERLLFLCSTAPSASSAGEGTSGTVGTSDLARPGRRHFSFCLQNMADMRIGGDGAASAGMGSGAGFSGLRGSSSQRVSCLEESYEPCIHSKGVWVAAAQRPGALSTEVSILVRVDACDDEGGARELQTTIDVDTPVLDIAEEREAGGALALGEGLAPGAPRSVRSFVLMLQSSVQVLRVSIKGKPLARAPASAAECRRYLAEMSCLPTAPLREGSHQWAWAFDDVGIPPLAEQWRALNDIHAVPALRLGRWFTGLLRFLMVVLRGVWRVPVVTPTKGRQFAGIWNQQSDGLSLAFSEETVRHLLGQLRPVLEFAKQGLQSVPAAQSPSTLVPSSAAARCRRFAHGQTTDREGLAQVCGTLRAVLAIADRAVQWLGLLSVMHSQRSAYRVLQSSVLTAGTLEALVQQPLGTLATSSSGLAPAAQLCTALLVESGLSTPATQYVFDSNGAGKPGGLRGAERSPVARELCRELEEQCPAVFALVNMQAVRARLGPSVSTDLPPANNVLRQCVRQVTSSPVEDPMALLRCSVQAVAAEDPEVLARNLKAAASEDPWAAINTGIDKLQQLQPAHSAGTAVGAQEAEASVQWRNEQAGVLLDTMLETLCIARPRSATVTPRALAEHLLVKTRSLRLFMPAGAAAELQTESAQSTPPVHTAILSRLLAKPKGHSVLEDLLSTSATSIQVFLQEQVKDSVKVGWPAASKAGELLWKLHLKLGKPAAAGEVLAQLAARKDPSCTLAERIRCLDLARQAVGQALPSSRDALDRLTAQLEVASRVQEPLCRELKLLAEDDRIALRWRRAAEERHAQLGELCGLQQLYQTAVDFGFFHVAFVVIDLSTSAQQVESVSSLWVSLLFPPADSPYAAAAKSHGDRAARPLGLFPLLMSRRSPAFLLQSDMPPTAPLPVGPPRKEDFRVRASCLLHELSIATKASSAHWNVRVVATLLEYAACLWRHVLSREQRMLAPSGAAASHSAAYERGSGGSTAPATPPPLPPPASPPPPLAEGVGGDADEAQPVERKEAGPKADLDLTWVATEILPGRPFQLAPSDIAKLYMELITCLPTWLSDLQGMLPADPTRYRPALVEEEVVVHLGEVVIGFLGEWPARPGAEALSTLLCQRLEGIRTEPHRSKAQRLLQEVQRLEARGAEARVPQALLELA